MSKLLTHSLVVLLVACLQICVVNAAVFIKIDGIEGESKDTSHQGEIDVLSWSWGAFRSVELKSGKGDSPKIGKTIGSMELSFTKFVDMSTTSLFAACANGKHIKEATLTVRRAGEDPLEYYIITMKRIMVTSVSTNGSGGEDQLTENVTLNFRDFSVQYLPQKQDGSVGEPIEYQWNIKGKKKG